MSNFSIEAVSRLRILVVSELDEQGQVLLRHLRRTRAAVRQQWPAPERIGENADMVFCDYGPGLGGRLAWMPGEPQAALVLLLPSSWRVDLREVKAACPDAVLHRPYTEQAIDVALTVAHDQFTYNKRQRSRIARMDENIHAMRDIEMAKHAIMARDNIGEAAAFRLLRTMAMQKRVSVAMIASKFIDSSNDRL